MIALFDSGIGGLTVLRTLLEKLPQESYLYLGDTARLPYGTKSPDTIRRYVEQNINYLLKQDVQAIVVACNSASSVLIGADLNFSVPIYNVIEPGAQVALQVSKNKRIGVLGTKATIRGGAYTKALHALDSKAQIFTQAAPLLVPLVEEGWEEDPLTNLVIYRYLSPLLAQGIDTLILGCTHYPALHAAIRKVAGPTVQLVDSSQAIATILAQDLKAKRFPSTPGSQRRYLATDISDGFVEVATRLLAPHPLGLLEWTDLV